VIASHYAEPIERIVASKAPLRIAPREDAESIAKLVSGDHFLLLDDSLGWSWGYAGKDRRVGYLRSDALSDQ